MQEKHPLTGKSILMAVGYLLCLSLMTGSPAWGAGELSPLAKTMKAYVDGGYISGFVSILATKNKIVQVDCYGMADIEAKHPMAQDTLFCAASMTKIVTAAALMTLVDEGKVSLDDPIDKYFPEFKNLMIMDTQKDGRVLHFKPRSIPTIRQCLSHTTGWPWAPPVMNKSGLDIMPLSRMVEEFSKSSLEVNPGTRYLYSQMGIDTVGAIIEKVSGMPYHKYLQKKFFTPLKMKNTTFWPSSKAIETKLAKIYTQKDGKLVSVKASILNEPYNDRKHRFAEPGGGMFTTPKDIIRFFQMLAGKGMYKGKRYLSEASVNEMFKKQTPANAEFYGLGSQTRGEAPDWFGHSGMYRTVGFACPSKGLARVWMIQATKVPKAYEAEGVWTKAALEAFKAKGL